MKRFESTLGAVAALALFAMMALTFVDVLARKLLGTSITGSVELTELLMLTVIFVALPLTSLRAEHVVFDLFDAMLPARVRALQHRLSNAVCVLLLAGGGWLVLVRAARTAEQGDNTAQLAIELAPFQYGAAAMLFATALMHLVLALRPMARASHLGSR
jgi:TRAP-type C4-dicarboxylate transport system permease small subunit